MENAFVFHDGQRAANPAELLHILKHIEPSFAAKHISPEHNDYANWIQHVVQDEKLARAVHTCRNTSEVLDVLRKYMHHEQHHAPEPEKHKSEAHERNAPEPEKHTSEAHESHTPEPEVEEPHPQPPVIAPPIPRHHVHHPLPSPEPRHEEQEEEVHPGWTPTKKRTPVGWEKPLRKDPIRELSQKGLREHPHVREFIVGLIIGIIIGAIATVLAI